MTATAFFRKSPMATSWRVAAALAGGWLLPMQVACAAELRYALAEPAFVTVVVEDSQGRRVRNLVAASPRPAGEAIETWDGCNDAGEPCAAGLYRWRGIARGAVESRFLGAFDSEGDPPWHTEAVPLSWHLPPSGSGGFLSDHERPSTLLAHGGDVFVGAHFAECGHSMARYDAASGRKLWGTRFVSLSGADAFAADGDTLFVAGEGGWMGDRLAVTRLNLRDHRFVPNPPDVAKRRTDAAFVKESTNDFARIRGMFLTPGEIVLSLGDRGGRLAYFSRETAEFLRDEPLPGAGEVATAPDGSVWALCDAGVKKVFDPHAAPPPSSAASAPLSSTSSSAPIPLRGVLRPRSLAIGAAGEFLIGDAAPGRCCVEVFSPDGRHLRTIGRVGGRREGPFDPLAMGEPAALCIDARGLLWVAERDFQPKRVSVWDAATGALARDYLGTPHYGGGGSVAPGPDGAPLCLYEGMAFDFREWPGRSPLRAVLFSPQEHPDLPCPPVPEAPGAAETRPGAPPPSSAVVAPDGRTYLVSDTGWDRPCHFVAEVVGDRAVPRAVFGALSSLREAWGARHPEFVAALPPQGGRRDGVFLWRDFDGDGRAAPEEVSVRADLSMAANWSLRTAPTLAFHARRLEDGALVAFDPAFSVAAPLFHDLASPSRVVPVPRDASGRPLRPLSLSDVPDGSGDMIVNFEGPEGSVSNALVRLAPGGAVCWSYPNPYPSNGHNSTLPDRGELRHVMAVEGWARAPALGGGARPRLLFQLSGNKGARYLFTADGLFVCELFADMRLAPSLQTRLSAARGDVLSTNSLSGESFYGWLGNGPGGAVWQIAGKSALCVCEVAGLDSIRDLRGGEIRLAAADAGARHHGGGADATREPLRVTDCGGFGFQSGWHRGAARAFPEDRVAEVALGVSRSGGAPGPLRLRVEVRDPSPWTNSGIDQDTLFHTGDCIDLRWAADPAADPRRRDPAPGDVRIVFAPGGGAGGVAAVRYVFVDPTVAAESRRSFSSPVGTARVDRIDRPRIMATVETTADGYVLVADIPWDVLGEREMPAHGEMRRADVGVVFGDAAGAHAVRRASLFDAESQVVDDLPSEVRVRPAGWGEVRF